MLTPKEQGFLDRFSVTEMGSMLISRLELNIVESQGFKRNVEIGKRIDSLHDQIRVSPREVRKVEVERKPWEEPDLSGIKPGECPF